MNEISQIYSAIRFGVPLLLPTSSVASQVRVKWYAWERLLLNKLWTKRKEVWDELCSSGSSASILESREISAPTLPPALEKEECQQIAFLLREMRTKRGVGCDGPSPTAVFAWFRNQADTLHQNRPFHPNNYAKRRKCVRDTQSGDILTLPRIYEPAQILLSTDEEWFFSQLHQMNQKETYIPDFRSTSGNKNTLYSDRVYRILLNAWRSDPTASQWMLGIGDDLTTTNNSLLKLQRDINEQSDSIRTSIDQERLISHINRFDVPVVDFITKPQQIVAWARRHSKKNGGDKHVSTDTVRFIDTVFESQLGKFFHTLCSNIMTCYLPYLLSDADNKMVTNSVFRKTTSIICDIFSLESNSASPILDMIHPFTSDSSSNQVLQAWINRLHQQISQQCPNIQFYDDEDVIRVLATKVIANQWGHNFCKIEINGFDINPRTILVRPKQWCRECTNMLALDRASCCCERYSLLWKRIETLFWCQHVYDTMIEFPEVLDIVKVLVKLCGSCDMSSFLKEIKNWWLQVSKVVQWHSLLLLFEFLMIRMESLHDIICETELVPSVVVRHYFNGLCRVVLQNATLWVRDRQNQPPPPSPHKLAPVQVIDTVVETGKLYPVTSPAPIPTSVILNTSAVPKIAGFSAFIPKK